MISALEAAAVAAVASAQIKREEENPKPGLWVMKLCCPANQETF